MPLGVHCVGEEEEEVVDRIEVLWLNGKSGIGGGGGGGGGGSIARICVP